MFFSRRVLLATLLPLLSLALPAADRSRPTRPPATDPNAYKGAIVMDADTGNILFEDRADIVSPPASMTKLMTFAVVHDRLRAGALQLDTPVRITPRDAAMGGTQVFLDPRETFTVEELIYAMMIQSANDAAHALAHTAGGSVPAFIALMNEKAAALGMTRTTFRTPHGLPPANRRTADGDLTSPRDFALLSRHLVQHTDALKYTSIRHRPFGEGSRPQPMAMKSHNNLLGRVHGVDGLKTGFTNGAGFCLAATAQRDQRRIIVVMMGSPQQTVRDLNVTALLEQGFTSLPPAPAVPRTTPATVAPPKAPPAPLMAPAPRADPSESPTAVEPVIKFSIPRK